jgi:hypothetical protein
MLPLPKLIVWASFVLGTTVWQRFYLETGSKDTIVAIVSAPLSLGVLSYAHANPVALPVIGCTLMGFVLGLLTMDTCFGEAFARKHLCSFFLTPFSQAHCLPFVWLRFAVFRSTRHQWGSGARQSWRRRW